MLILLLALPLVGLKAQYLLGYSKTYIILNEAKYDIKTKGMMNDTSEVIVGTMPRGGAICYILNRKKVAVSSVISYFDRTSAMQEMKELDLYGVKQSDRSWIITLDDGTKLFVSLGYAEALGYTFTHIALN